MMFTVLAFLITVCVLVVVHEYGHYRVATACGVKVHRFSIGFGPVIWRYQRSPGSTEFVLSALPLGGYVQMLDEREGPVAAHELGRAFNRKPLWQRAAVVAAGPLFNLGLAVLLYSITHWMGVQEPKARFGTPVAGSLSEQAGLQAGDWVKSYSFDGRDWQELRSANDVRWVITQAILNGSSLHWRVSDGSGHAERAVQLELSSLGTQDIDAQLMRRIGLGAPYSEARLGAINPKGAAAKAGLLPGDRVQRVDGLAIEDSEQLRSLIRAYRDPQVPMTWLIERAGQRQELQVRPAIIQEGDQRLGRIDAIVGQPAETVMVRYGVWEGGAHAMVRTWEVAALSLKMLGRMIIGQASIKNLSGPLTIADYADQSMRQGAGYYLGFLAVVSISIGVLNLLPLPMLDGGHLMYYLFEALTGYPPSEVWLERLQRVGLAIMLLMMSLAFYNDVVRYMGPH